MRLLKSDPRWQQALQEYPYVFSVKDYGYFYSRAEWGAIPFVNSQPSFNATSQFLEVRMIETAQGVRREWFVSDNPIEE
jgi:hypothetical protein